MDVKQVLSRYENRPGLQYQVMGAQGVLSSQAVGLRDVVGRLPMTESTAQMAYSMSKVITAIVALRLADRGVLDLERPLVSYLTDLEYPETLKLRHLISQTSGLPNPLPFSWTHLPTEEQGFDHRTALREVLEQHTGLGFEPGSQYSYSNLSYWLLEAVIEDVTGRPFEQVVAQEVTVVLGLGTEDLGYQFPDQGEMAKGYLYKYSWINLLKGLILPKAYYGGYEGRWFWVKPHQLNSKGMGGVITSAQGLGVVLTDLLQPDSKLLSPRAKGWLFEVQQDPQGNPLPMTLGWHVRFEAEQVAFFYKEGGGAGFHGEMRLYPDEGIASVVLSNETGFDVKKFLNRCDPVYF